MCKILLPPVYHVFGSQILFLLVRDCIKITVHVAAHLVHECANRFDARSLVLLFLPFQYFKVVFDCYRLNANTKLKFKIMSFSVHVGFGDRVKMCVANLKGYL